MSYFATYQKVQSLGNLPKVDQAKIEIHFPAAKDDVIDVIGQDKYDELIVDETADDFKKIQTAESYLALKYLIPAINIESTGNGVTKATGFGDSRKENLSEFDVDKIIERFEDNAMRILKRYAREIDEDEDENPDIVNAGSIKMACITAEEEDE